MITLDQLAAGFEPLQLAFSKKLSDPQLQFWHGLVEYKDLDVFKETCKRLIYGEYFPKPKDFTAEYRNCQSLVGGKKASPDDLPSCGICIGGKVYLEKRNKDGTFSQPYVYACGECRHAILSNFRYLTIPEIKSMLDGNWELDSALAKKRQMIRADEWLDEGENVSSAEALSFIRGLGHGKPDRVKEARRNRSLDGDAARELKI